MIGYSMSMENFNLPNKSERNNNNFDRHKNFFSAEKLKKFIGNSMITTGALLTLAGIYESLTGEKIGLLLNGVQNEIPNALNWAINHLDNMDTLRKTGGGSSLIMTGLAIDGYFGDIWSKKKSAK